MQRIIIDELYYNDIPYTLYSRTKDIKGLVFVQHGYQSNKNRGSSLLALNLARLGFKVVAIDAYKHGSRLEEPYISESDFRRETCIFEVVRQTSLDIITMYQELFEKDFPTFDFVGVSMGGMIGYYLITITEKVNRFVPVISIPNFTDLALDIGEFRNDKRYQRMVLNQQPFLDSIDPIKRVYLMRYNEMFILNALHDEVLPNHYAKDFYKNALLHDITFKEYAEKHVVSREMLIDILSFISKEKVVL